MTLIFDINKQLLTIRHSKVQKFPV